MRALSSLSGAIGKHCATRKELTTNTNSFRIADHSGPIGQHLPFMPSISTNSCLPGTFTSRDKRDVHRFRTNNPTGQVAHLSALLDRITLPKTRRKCSKMF